MWLPVVSILCQKTPRGPDAHPGTHARASQEIQSHTKSRRGPSRLRPPQPLGEQSPPGQVTPVTITTPCVTLQLPNWDGEEGNALAKARG